MKSGSFEHGRDRRNDRLVQARGCLTEASAGQLRGRSSEALVLRGQNDLMRRRIVHRRGYGRRPDKYWSRLERHPRRHHLALQLHSLRSLDFSSYSLLKTVKILSL
jgi:hypothetical protein